MSDQFERKLKEALERRAEGLPAESYERLREIDYHPRSPAPRVAFGVAGIAALAAAAGISLSLVGVGGGPQRAFAGWTAVPTAPQPGQRAAAEAVCETRAARAQKSAVALFLQMRRHEAQMGRPSIHPPPRVGGAFRTIFADVRGPYTLVILTNSEANARCLVGPQRAEVADIGLDGPTLSRVAVAPDRIGAISLGLTRALNDKPFKYVAGRAGRGVREVRIALADGRRVSATVGEGWYLAWWPGTEPIAAIEVVTATGTHTQSMAHRRVLKS